jgi:hypothetical protein
MRCASANWSAIIVTGLLFHWGCRREEATGLDLPAPPPVAAPAPAATPEPKIGDVKRYADQEQSSSGTVKVGQQGASVYNQTDERTAAVASLNSGIYVNRLAKMGDWLLVEFPSGVGQLSPGWVKSSNLDSKVQSVSKDKVASQAPAKKPPTTDAGAQKTQEQASGTGGQPTTAAGTGGSSAAAPSASATTTATATATAAATASAPAATTGRLPSRVQR